MDFAKLQDIKFDTSNSNSTLTSLPSLLLDNLIPGYGFISQIILRLLGFDIGLVVSGCLVLYGLSLGAYIFYYKAKESFSQYFISSVEVEDDDTLFLQIMEWIAEQRMTKKSRSLKAVTKWVSAWYESDEERNAHDDDVLDESGIFNYEKWASTIPPQYEPNYGSDRFWFEGRMFFFTRMKREKQVRIWGGGDDQFLNICCIGRSTEPIKQLLDHIKKWTLKKDSKMTAINRPAPKEERKDYAWDRQSLRPSRPMGTVSLDQEQKIKIVRDINEYLHPASARWYAARGIPYRRGYLFHGPPGTGKTSLSFALAGIFGLDIYCISLMEVGLTESDLSKLFSDLPRRSIVLLEDIDSAGLRRPNEPSESKSDTKSDDTKEELISDIVKVEDTANKIPGQLPNTTSTGGIKSLISLSGLLNVIDGVASHEGRVLIMTTNCPSKLDPALIRPGRVDLQVEFTLATCEQTRDIFHRMYNTDRDEPTKPRSKPKPKAQSTPSPSKTSRPSTPLPPSSKKHNPTTAADERFLALLSNTKSSTDFVEPEKLAEMADEFAALLPEGKISPAEIQGFLLMRKKEPERALEEVGAWRDALLQAREKGERVLGVQ